MTEFPEYNEYYDGDMWPAYKGNLIDGTWVGDMAPQHCASSIWKVRKWCNEQWSDELMNEREWARFTKSRLFYHLASRAICFDFSDAVLVPDLPPEGLSIQKVGDLMGGCVLIATGLTKSQSKKAGIDMAKTLEANHYIILKVSP